MEVHKRLHGGGGWGYCKDGKDQVPAEPVSPRKSR